MTYATLDNIAAEWSALGVMYGAEPRRTITDLERLLVVTAAAVCEMPRLLDTTMTWLAQCERLVARHRLARLADEIGDPEQSASLGLILDLARSHTSTNHLSCAIRVCKPVVPPRPMLQFDRTSTKLTAFARDYTGPTARAWGLWTDEPPLKRDAIRPMSWILRRNPDLRIRAILGGDLRASVLAALEFDDNASTSESALAHACGATRMAVRAALDQLELCGLVRREQHGRSIRIRPCRIQIRAS